MKTDSKFTPGPWHTGVRTAHHGRDVYGPLGDLIAVADTFQTSEEEAKANAELIARAPELLAEVERLRAENGWLLERLATLERLSCAV